MTWDARWLRFVFISQMKLAARYSDVPRAVGYLHLGPALLQDRNTNRRQSVWNLLMSSALLIATANTT